MHKKIIACFLALCLAVCLAACGTSTSSNSGNLPWQQQVTGQISAQELMPPAPDDNVRTWYEVFVYSFADSNGDGIGDLAGLTSQLDYIRWLGFNGIWLMPVHPSPTYHKYDVTDYYAIDPQYGTMQDFEAFMAACEERGIHVILDLVVNHTSSQHPWFTTAVQALKDGNMAEPTIDYYHFSQSESGGAWHTATGDWKYEGMFWDGMPDLNLQSGAVRTEIENIAAFWLDKGVSGFRLDAVKEFETGNTAANIEILSWLNGMVKSHKPDAYLVGEDWDMTTGLYDYYSSGIDSFFDYPYATQDGRIAKTVLLQNQSAEDYALALLDTQERIAAQNPNATDAPFFINHDNARAAGFLRRDAALIKTAWGMSLMQSGNAFVYYGEELGMSGSGKDENKRAPMFWSADATADGMCSGPPGMESMENSFAPAPEQMADETSILNYIRKAVGLRAQYPAIARGTVSLLSVNGGDKVCALQKTWQGESIILVYNLGSTEETITLPSEAINSQLADWLTADITQTPALQNGQLTLPPYTIALLSFPN